MALHIVAPTFNPAVVGGAGGPLIELTARFLRDLPGTRVYLNESVASRFPAWGNAVVPLRCGPMAKPTAKMLALTKLELFGFPEFPRDGVCWFPFGPMLPLRFRGGAVSTIHDTLERDMPAFLPVAERIFRRVLLPRTVKSTTVATVSQFSAQRIREHYGVESKVIRWGTTSMPAPDEELVPSQPFVFYPANAFAHKNHRFLLELWQREPKLSSIALVFTLGSGVAGLSGNISLARAAGVNVIVTGRITRAAIAGFYRRAVCAVLPSMYEGFGLLMHEALLCECPVLANASSPPLRESVTGDYPFFLPLQEKRWIDAILGLPRTKDSNFSKYVLSRSWDDCAKEYVELFQQVEDGLA
jgi:glycosyltransferase involved in cell wall biosynthesis